MCASRLHLPQSLVEIDTFKKEALCERESEIFRRYETSAYVEFAKPGPMEVVKGLASFNVACHYMT